MSLGNFALFRWRRQSCPADEGHSCRLDHGDILVMDGQCQDEFLHRTEPGREQERSNVKFSSCPLFKAGVACFLPTCAQGSSVPVMENTVNGVFFFALFGFFLVSCAHGEFWFFWAPCCVQDLGYSGVPPVGHARWAEVGGGGREAFPL